MEAWALTRAEFKQRHTYQGLCRKFRYFVTLCIRQVLIVNLFIIIQQKEQRCRDNFEANALTLRKPRNPCTGELTSREDAPFLIPLEKIMKDNMESESYIKFEKTKVDMAESLNRQSMILALPVKQRDVLKVSRVRKLRSEVDREIETLKRVAEYKKDQLQRLTQSKFSGHVDQTNS